MLREQQIEERRKRATAEGFLIRRQDGQPRSAGGPWTDYSVRNKTSGRMYRVALRGPSPFDNYCECPDYRVNTLGTCKHIEAVLATVSNRKKATTAHSAKRSRSEIYLRYGTSLDVCLRHGRKASRKLQTLTSKFFDSAGVLIPEKLPQFHRLLADLQSLDDEVVIYSDTLEYIDRQAERMADQQREARDMVQLQAGRLNLQPLKVQLYPYQQQGVLFACRRGRVVLGDDMGLGKTIQAIAAAEMLAREKNITKVLVICPASLKYQWESEIRKMCDRSVHVLEGNMVERRRQYRLDRFFTIVNYEAALRDVDTILEYQPDLIILDEAQRIKNWQTKTAQAIKRLRSRYAFVLTGTPMENKLEELYSIVQFVDDRRLGPAFQFLNDHLEFDARGKLIGYRGLDRIREKLSPILMRRRREDVLKQLPERFDNNVFVEMTPEQKLPHDEQYTIVGQIVTKWERTGFLSEIDHRRLMCALQNMRMLCDSTFLFDKETNISPKLAELEALFRDIVLDGGEKVVLFSQWERMTHLVGELLDRLKIPYVSLHGGVPTKRRRQIISDFRENEKIKVFLSTDAGGVGLNLQAASTVINVDLPWNPAVLEQRIARVHRLGQHRPVHVVNLISKNGFEERILGLLSIKKATFKGLFDGTANEINFEKMGKKGLLKQVKEMMGPVTQAPPRPPEQPVPERPVPSLTDTGPRLIVRDDDAAPTTAYAWTEVVSMLGLAAGALVQAVTSPQAGNGNDGKRAERPAVQRPARPPAFDAAQVAHVVSQRLTTFLETDPRSGRPALNIPLPSPETLQRGLTALVHALGGKP
ncbi:MAG: DEAD/DEAH box helicase [Phycisphaerae bacterium]|nr:DEAD/DEAH box helicase [Phycisphaerae bacterium]